MSFAKLDAGILRSTLWQEPDHVLRIWITLLALADARGRVTGSIPGLAHTATKSVPETEDALARLLRPDPYSRTQTHEGRRIAVIPGGWLLLNYVQYREARDPEARRAWDRARWETRRMSAPDSTGTPSPGMSVQTSVGSSSTGVDDPLPPPPLPPGCEVPAQEDLTSTPHPLVAASAPCQALSAHGQAALSALLGRSARPTALLAEVAMILQGGRAHVPSDPIVVAQALADLTLATGAISGLMLRTFVQRAARESPGVPVRGDPGDATGPRRTHPLSPQEAFVVAYEDAVAHERVADAHAEDG